MLSKQSQFNLINAANVKSQLLEKNYIRNLTEFENFDIHVYGLPILIEADDQIFNFKLKDTFTVETPLILSRIYNHNDRSYVGFKHAFKSNRFLTKINIKSEYAETLDELVKQNLQTQKKILELKTLYGKVGAFQTRNIPHYGHEAIINLMLEKCDHVVINPVIGPKKKGDIQLHVLQKAFEFIASNKYQNKLSFTPIFANMYYAGPNEALHHCVIRQMLGFDLFSVGRDHAGADGFYPNTAATNLLRKAFRSFNLSLLLHEGAVYCKSCKHAVAGKCKDTQCEVFDISGTNFRKCLEKRELFEFADADMQRYILQEEEIFEK